MGWFSGRMEFGPRAPGARSILADARIADIRDRINLTVKFREDFRPFAPAILREEAKAWFKGVCDSPYMLFTFPVLEERQPEVPGIVHVDGSARPQLVDRERAPLFHALLTAFHEKTGLPVVINTSLNRRGEPMVCSPEDAIAMFFGSGLEFMVLEDVLVSKRALPG